MLQVAGHKHSSILMADGSQMEEMGLELFLIKTKIWLFIWLSMWELSSVKNQSPWITGKTFWKLESKVTSLTWLPSQIWRCSLSVPKQMISSSLKMGCSFFFKCLKGVKQLFCAVQMHWTTNGHYYSLQSALLFSEVMATVVQPVWRSPGWVSHSSLK